jgi:hypothetical protein
LQGKRLVWTLIGLITITVGVILTACGNLTPTVTPVADPLLATIKAFPTLGTPEPTSTVSYVGLPDFELYPGAEKVEVNPAYKDEIKNALSIGFTQYSYDLFVSNDTAEKIAAFYVIEFKKKGFKVNGPDNTANQFISVWGILNNGPISVIVNAYKKNNSPEKAIADKSKLTGKTAFTLIRQR